MKGDKDDDNEEEISVFIPEDYRNLPAALGQRVSKIDARYEIWSANHLKVLYMLSKYAKASQRPEDESWCREGPLSVLLFEGIVSGTINFDYSPKCTVVHIPGGSTRLWMNISQEAKACLDDLREERLIMGLKLATDRFQPVTAVQVSAKGLEVLKSIKETYKNEVDRYITNSITGKLLSIKFDINSRRFYFVDLPDDEDEIVPVSISDAVRISKVTNVEDVSYVSSPYLPSCMRNSIRIKELSTNRNRAHEAAAGGDNIEDELSEAITLSNVRIIVAEWIPFDANQMVALNTKLGSTDRCKGGFLSNHKENSSEATVKTPSENTVISLLDYSMTESVNFEAEINFSEDAEEGKITQVETFGVHIKTDGTVLYGLHIEAVGNRLRDRNSVDHISRVLVDVQQDSTRIMNDILSPYQIGLMNSVFEGDTESRIKYNLIIADKINPDMDAKCYMGRDEYEFELKQVLGDIHAVYKVDNGKITIILGRDGALLAGRGYQNCEQYVLEYLSLQCRDLFIRQLFAVVIAMDNEINKIRELILCCNQDPHNIERIQRLIIESGNEVEKLSDSTELMLGSLETIKIAKKLSLSPNETRSIRYELLTLFQMDEVLHDVTLRANDLRNILNGVKTQLSILQAQSKTIDESSLTKVLSNIEGNFRKLVDSSQAEARANISVAVMEIILSGGFAFTLVDRLDGDSILGYYGVSAGGYAVGWIDTYIRNTVVIIPGVWWLLNMMWLLVIIFALKRFMNWLSFRLAGIVTARFVVNRKINVRNLENYIANRYVISIDAYQKSNLKKVSVQYNEDNRDKVYSKLPTGKPIVVNPYDSEYFLKLSELKENSYGNLKTSPWEPNPSYSLTPLNIMYSLLVVLTKKIFDKSLTNIIMYERSRKTVDSFLQSVRKVPKSIAAKRKTFTKSNARARKKPENSLWSGEPPKVQLIFDKQSAYLLEIHLQWNSQRNPLSAEELMRTLLKTYMKHDIFVGRANEL